MHHHWGYSPPTTTETNAQPIIGSLGIAVLQSSKYKCDGSIANIGGHIVEQGSNNWFQATRMGVG